MNLSDILGKAAPWLAAAAAGPAGLAGMAIKTVAEAMGAGTDDAGDLAAAVAGATPEQVQALKRAEMDFKARMQDLGFKQIRDLEAIAAADRASAREREIKAGDSWTPRLLAVLVVAAWVSVQWFLLNNIVPGEMRELVARVLGTLDTALIMVLAYYFGSSAGSAAKNQMLKGGGSS